MTNTAIKDDEVLNTLVENKTMLTGEIQGTITAEALTNQVQNNIFAVIAADPCDVLQEKDDKFILKEAKVIKIFDLNKLISKFGKGLNLSNSNLKGAQLQSADLRFSNLENCNLQGANLREANLKEANLAGANMEGSNLTEANLFGADLTNTDLRRANMTQAELRNTTMIGTSLRGAELWSASMWGVNIEKSFHKGVDLSRADTRGS